MLERPHTRLFALLPALSVVCCLLITACTSKHPPIPTASSVRDYKYFPEYRGFMPIVAKDNQQEIRADWVIPISADGGVSYELPQTPQEAESRTNAHTQDHEIGKGTALALKTVGIIASPVLLPLFIALDPLDHLLMHTRSESAARQIKTLAAVDFTFNIQDPDGHPLHDVKIVEVNWSVKFSLFADKQGIRRFSPEQKMYVSLNENALRSMADHLPIYLGRSVHFSNSHGWIIGIPDYNAEGFYHADGSFHMTSDRFKIYTRFDAASGQWKWVKQPRDMTFDFIFWAPGYKPEVLSITDILPGDRVARTIVLSPLPDNSHILNLHVQLQNIVDRAIAVAKHPVLSAITINEDQKNEIIYLLRNWTADSSLPGYFRWNAAQILTSILKYTEFPLEKSFRSETSQLLERYRSEISSLSEDPDGDDNLWKLKKDRSNLQWRVRFNGQPSMETIDLRGAKTMLTRFAALGINTPVFDMLRSDIATAEKTSSLDSLLKYVDHYDFISAFYGDNYKIVFPDLR